MKRSYTDSRKGKLWKTKTRRPKEAALRKSSGFEPNSHAS